MDARTVRSAAGWTSAGLRVLVSAAVLASVGCTGTQQAGPERTVPARARAVHAVIGHSVEGAPIETYTYGEGVRTVLIMATIHGSEAVGTPLVRRLGTHLEENPDLLAGRRVILLPVANPDGMKRGVRHNARGVDLNRNFPADNFTGRARHGQTALSEPESRALEELLRTASPSVIVTIHQPLTCMDYDGPGEALARAMAATCDLPVKRLGSRPGSLGSYAGETLGIPIITVEFARAADNLDLPTLWERYGQMLLVAIAWERG